MVEIYCINPRPLHPRALSDYFLDAKKSINIGKCYPLLFTVCGNVAHIMMDLYTLYCFTDHIYMYPSKPLQITTKIAFFDPNFTFCFPKSHKNPGVGGCVNRFGKGLPKKNVFFAPSLMHLGLKDLEGSPIIHALLEYI